MRLLRHSLTVTAAVLFTALAFGGCASSPAAGKPGSAPAPSTGLPPSASPSIPTDGQLRSALLTAADLGGNFTATGPGADAGGFSTSGCPALDALVTHGGAFSQGNQQDAFFTAGAAGPFLEEVLAADSPSNVAAGFAQLRDAFASCTSWTISGQGSTLTFDLTPITFIPGPNTTSVRLDGSYQGVEIDGYVVCERFTSVALGYVYFQIGGGSSQVAYSDYTQAATKAEQVLALGSETPGSL